MLLLRHECCLLLLMLHGQLAQARVIKTQVCAKVLEISMTQWFSENIGDVVAGAHTIHAKFPFRDHIVDVVEFHMDMFDMRVEDVVF